MYAIVKDRTRQYKVEPNQELLIDLMDAPQEAGKQIQLNEVLYVNTGKEIKIGTPLVPGAQVTFEVLGEEKGKKVVIFKFKRRKGYLRKTGHRQQYVRVKVKDIQA